MFYFSPVNLWFNRQDINRTIHVTLPISFSENYNRCLVSCDTTIWAPTRWNLVYVISLPRHSLAAVLSGWGPSHFSPETHNQISRGSYSMDLNEVVQLLRTRHSLVNAALLVSSHRCSEPTAQICPIRKRSLGFRPRGTPAAGNQRPGKISQHNENECRGKGSTESCHNVRNCGSACFWLP